MQGVLGGMAKKRQRLKRAVTVATIPAAPYDRRATDLLRNAVVAPVVVDDPYERGAKVTVLRSLRDDPLGRMHARHQVDDAQEKAGRRWQGFYETAEGRGAGAIDPTKEAVDGGRFEEPFTDEKKEAALQLNYAARILGMLGESVLRDVLANRMFPEEVAIARGHTSQRAIDHYSWLFRQSLEALAIAYGFAMRSDLSTTSRNSA
jgi:hypothetical protein